MPHHYSRRLVLVALVLGGVGVLTGCAAPSDAHAELRARLPGLWLEDVPGMPGLKQGWTLFADGAARESGTATLLVCSWALEGRTLVLKGRSLGNGVEAPYEEHLEIVRCTDAELVLRRGELERTLVRAPER